LLTYSRIGLLNPSDSSPLPGLAESGNDDQK